MTNSLSRAHWSALLTAVATLIALTVPLAGTAAANHESRLLDVEPESAELGVGSEHTMTAALDEPAGSSGTINIDFENEGGVNDSDGDTPESPDLTCSIPTGQSSCSVSYIGDEVGDDTWRSWIDHDGSNSTTEADSAEGPDEQLEPGFQPAPCGNSPGDMGGPAEPDCTDVVEVTWTAGPPAAVDCDDSGDGPDTERETNRSGGGSESNEVYDCTVTDEFGNPAEDSDPNNDEDDPVTVDGEVENDVNDPDSTDGASYDSPDYSCTVSTTNSAEDGMCSITVTQNENETGTAEICFFVGDASTGASVCGDEETGEGQQPDGSDEGNDLADQVEKTWAEPAASSVDAEPETATNDLGDEHTITATVFDQFGESFNGNTTVSFEFFEGSPSDDDGNTPSTPDDTCTTDGSSSCEISYTNEDEPGRDLVCVFIGPAPAMTGETCDGEALEDPDDTPDEPDGPDEPGDDQDVVEKIWDNPNDASRLNCRPETDSTSTNASHEVTCTASDDNGAPVGDTVVLAEASGANDPDEGDSPESPDFQCTTAADGTCSFTHDPGADAEEGTTTYRAFVDDSDILFGPTIDEGEGRDETTEPGDEPEPDTTDVVENEWTKGGGGNGCDIEGTPGDDTLIGTPGKDVICGKGGNDTIRGRGGNDVLRGGRGADKIRGGSGADEIEGGRGADDLRGGSGRDKLSGGDGRDDVRGGGGRDQVGGGKGPDDVRGGRGHDTVNGGRGNDALAGGRGNDRLDGGPGRDSCRGGPGRDTKRRCER